jgi:hypothetical protein
MNRIAGLVGISCLGLAAASGLMAQEPPPPPKVIQIFREEVKPGKGAAHEKLEAQWPALFRKANDETHYLAMTTLTGPSEAWFLTGYDSFEAWEKDINRVEKDAALKAELAKLSEKDAEFISGGRSIVLVNRPELNNGPHVDISKMRYMQVITYRVKPGHEKDFMDAAKVIKEAYAKAKIERSWALFQVNGGMQIPTFMVWIPMKSLADVDTAFGHLQELRDAQGEEGQKAIAKAAGEGYASIDSQILAFNPRMSYPSKQMAAGDPEFWNPKPVAAAPKATGAKKTTPKKEAAKPAEKK